MVKFSNPFSVVHLYEIVEGQFSLLAVFWKHFYVVWHSFEKPGIVNYGSTFLTGFPFQVLKFPSMTFNNLQI